MPAKTPLIKIRELHKSYPEGENHRTLFTQLDLDIAGGEFVALVGRSGSGKSTLLNLVSGIDLPDAGQIQVGDCVINTLNETERTRFRRRQVGFVFQFFNLIPTLTVEENVLLPLELNQLNGAEHQQRVFGLLEQVGLVDHRRRFPEQLSGGEQQRLAIVRALAHAPVLVLADEPTGNLDTDNSNRVMELLRQLHQHVGSTVLMVTHSLEIAAQADRILRLEAGQLRELMP
jgi:putative ABC transport system ATP-binding protein